MTDSLRDQLLGLGFKPAPKPERPERPDRSGKADHRPHSAAPPRDGNPRARQGKPGRPDRAKADGARRAPDPGRPQTPSHAQRAHPRAGAPDARGRQAAQRPDKPGGEGRHRPGAHGPRSREDIDLAKAYAIRAQREKDERIAAEKAKQDEARLRREAKAKLAQLLKDQALNDPAADIARHFDYGGKIKRVHVTADQLRALNAGELGVVQLDGRYVLIGAALLAEAEAIFAPAIALKVDPSAPAADDPYADPQYRVPDDLVW